MFPSIRCIQPWKGGLPIFSTSTTTSKPSLATQQTLGSLVCLSASAGRKQCRNLALDSWFAASGRGMGVTMLRLMLQLRRRPSEDFVQYTRKSAAMITKWISDSSCSFAFAMVMKAVFKGALRQDKSKLDSGDAPLEIVIGYRTALWRTTVQALAPPAKRRWQSETHVAQGRPLSSCEHPFTSVWGDHWRAERHACRTLGQWMRKCHALSKIM